MASWRSQNAPVTRSVVTITVFCVAGFSLLDRNERRNDLGIRSRETRRLSKDDCSVHDRQNAKFGGAGGLIIRHHAEDSTGASFVRK